MESQPLFRRNSGAVSWLAFAAPGFGIAAIGYIVFLAANPVLVSNTAILFVLNAGLSIGAYAAVFLSPLVIIGIVQRDLGHKFMLRLAATAYSILVLWLVAAALGRFVTIPVYYVGSDGAIIRRLSGPVAISLSNGASVQLLAEENRLFEERHVRRGFVNRDIRSIIINDTAKNLRFEKVIYGSAPDYVPRPVPDNKDIGPYSAVDLAEDVDYFGPDDHPAPSVRADKRSYYTSRRWLTW